MSNEQFNPYIEGVIPLSTAETDSHVQTLPSISFYGETPKEAQTALRNNFDPIIIEDDSGQSVYSVLISGDLLEAKKILIKTMSWSDHPGRGFEALREALIADPSNKLAVIGVSFPGAGTTEQGLTKKQAESLSGKQGDFSFIAAQQWRAIFSAARQELLRSGVEQIDISKRLFEYEYLLSGSSQGASNAVGLLQELPQGIKATALGLLEDTSLEARGRSRFMLDFALGGNKHFKDYTSVNPYNEYEPLGPSMNLGVNVFKHPGSHLGPVINAMSRGGGVDKIIEALKLKEIKDFEVRIAAAEHDRVGSAAAAERAAARLSVGGFAVAKTVIWKGHYHPAMENLSNAQQAFRSLAK